MKNNQNILVVGSQGYIGTVLCDYLLKKNLNVFAIDNFIYNQKKNFFLKKNYFFVKCDLRNDVEILKILKKVSKVIILSGLVGDPITKKYPKLSTSINLKGIKKLIKACNKTQIKQLIFISTCSNYGIANSNKPLKENHHLNPISLYAKHKVAIEKFLLDNNFNFSTTILRFATAFGVSPRMRFDLTVNEFVKDAFLKNELEIYEPNTYRPYCHVKDFSQIIYLVLKQKSGKFEKKQILNCGSNANNYTKMDIAKLLQKKFKNLKIIINKKKHDKRNYKVNFNKLNKTLNFTPKHNIDFAITEILKYLKKNKKKFKNYKKENFGNYYIDSKN